jgi:hypothetical protein
MSPRQSRKSALNNVFRTALGVGRSPMYLTVQCGHEFYSNRPVEALLPGSVIQAASRWSSIVTIERFHGSNSPMRVIGCSAMRSSTVRK